MADIILHSGSFCDRNNNEISITFFKRTSTPVMTVDPTALSFTSNGGTKTLRVSNYTGTLSISVSGGTGWLSRTQSTSSGVRTYTFTATANTSTSMRNATVTLTDSNSTVTVGVTQAGVTSMVAVNPDYLVFNKNGETKTTTVTWTGGSTPTWSNTPEWASITSSVSGGTMTLNINVGPNSGQYQRNATVYVSNGISRADLFLEQEAVHTVSVQPSSFSFPASGGTQILTITDIQGSFSMNYDGDGLSVVLLDYPSSTSRRYNVTYTPNTVTATRTGVINVSDTAGGWVSIPTTQAANTDTFAVDPTSFQYGGTGSTNTFTFTGVPAAGLSYEIPSGIDWVTVSNLSNSSVDITTSANNNPTSRTTTVKFYDQDDNTNYVTVTVNQEAGQSSLSVVPSSITYLPAGGTYGITATWTAGTEPTATVTYVQGTGGWMTPTGSGSVTGNTKEWAWTASANYTGSSRTALITVTNGLQSEYVTVSQSSGVVSWSVTPSSIPDATAAGLTYTVTITGAPSGGMSYDVIYGSGDNWITITNFSQNGCSLTTSANGGVSSRSATVKFIDLDDIDHYIYLTITQEGTAVAALSVMDASMSFAAEGGRDQTTVQNIVGTLTTTQPSWITLAMSGEGGTRLVSVHASANPSSTARSGAVNFDDDRQSPVSMAVSQEGASGYVSPSTLTFVAAGETKSFTCTYPSAWEIRYTYHRGSGWLSNSYVNSTITAQRNSTSYNRTATVTFYDTNTNEEIGTIEVTQYVEAMTVNPSQMTVGPTKANTQYVDYYIVGVGANTTPINATVSESWLSVVRTGGTSGNQFHVYTSTNTSSTARTGTISFNVGDQSGTCIVTQRSGELYADKQRLDYSYSSGTQSIGITYDTSLSLSYPSWISMSNVSTSGSGEETPFIGSYNVTVASNTGTSSRSGYIACSTPYAQMSIPVNQEGLPSISVTPSRLDFSYINNASTLTVSGVPSGGFSTSISYITGASGWLSTTNTAYNIIVTASGTTYPSSRTATLTVTNASDATDFVDIPITQAGNPGVLSVTPNAWNYSSSIGTHTFTVTYSASGSITYSVAYEREEGEPEVDWIQVELVSHSAGSETWEYCIDVDPNNSGSGRAAMVTFEGDGGGADEVSVYQQP